MVRKGRCEQRGGSTNLPRTAPSNSRDVNPRGVLLNVAIALALCNTLSRQTESGKGEKNEDTDLVAGAYTLASGRIA